MDCTLGQWEVMVTEYDDSSLSGIIQDMLDQYMTVKRGPCWYEDEDEAKVDDEGSIMYTMIMPVASFIALVALGVVVFCAWRRIKTQHYVYDDYASCFIYCS